MKPDNCRTFQLLKEGRRGSRRFQTIQQSNIFTSQRGVAEGVFFLQVGSIAGAPSYEIIRLFYVLSFEGPAEGDYKPRCMRTMQLSHVCASQGWVRWLHPTKPYNSHTFQVLKGWVRKVVASLVALKPYNRRTLQPPNGGLQRVGSFYGCIRLRWLNRLKPHKCRHVPGHAIACHAFSHFGN